MHDLDRTQIGFTGEEESYGPGPGGVFSEEEQMDLAAEMMEVNSEEEFEEFLGDLISKGVQTLGSFIGAPAGQALGGVLKSAAKRLLPMAGQALGGFLGGPAGAAIGGQLGSAAFESEEEQQEQQEWEAANAFVKMAGEAVKNVAAAPPAANPQAAAKTAVVEAAKVHAPAIVPALANGAPHMNGAPHGFEPPEGYGASGTWVRHGRKIFLRGV
jgi:phage tail tape-measure protein